MAASFFFYDLETSGIDPRTARIMQFAGQRTDLELNPIGEPVNILVKLTPDILPEPDAIMVTGITPQQTLMDGVTEAEFLKEFMDTVCTPETTMLGFNSIRFDDEFMRHTLYRNFYDAYEWQWTNGCTRWDLLDVVRMTRALRPQGIEWPFTDEGKPTNRLELLTKSNGLKHEAAHDALSDVHATIDMARLIKAKQPDLFAYLLKCRSKQEVKRVVQSGQPFVYTSGRYPSEHLHTTAAALVAAHPKQDCATVYDLRHDPTPFIAMNPEELASGMRYSLDKEALKVPVKLLKYNRCPAVAPLGVLGSGGALDRVHLKLNEVEQHQQLLADQQATFAEKLVKAIELIESERTPQQVTAEDVAVDGGLYDGFFSDQDKQLMRAIRSSSPEELSKITMEGADPRLQKLLPLYKARNFPASLTSEERKNWDELRKRKLTEGGDRSELARFGVRLEELARQDLDENKRFLLEEMQLYAQSIIQFDD